jgi:septum formation protein
MTQLVLASASSGRLSVLRAAGVKPHVIVSNVDEDAIIATVGAANPDQVVSSLATAKADAVAADLPTELADDCVVIGCDSMLYLEGRLYGKPGSAAAARAQWQAMAGRAGQLHTGHAVLRLRNGRITYRQVESATTTVHFATPEPDDLAAYIDSGEPLAVAGGFTLDGLGGWFVERIEGDPSNVIGLSLPLVRRLLARAELSIGDMWTANPG